MKKRDQYYWKRDENFRKKRSKTEKSSKIDKKWSKSLKNSKNQKTIENFLTQILLCLLCTLVQICKRQGQTWCRDSVILCVRPRNKPPSQTSNFHGFPQKSEQLKSNRGLTEVWSLHELNNNSGHHRTNAGCWYLCFVSNSLETFEFLFEEPLSRKKLTEFAEGDEKLLLLDRAQLRVHFEVSPECWTNRDYDLTQHA